MSKPQVRQSLKDVLPTCQEPFPRELVSFTDSLYLRSMQIQPKLPNRAEIARYHICAYLSAEKYQQALSLPNPSLAKVPVQAKLVNKLLDDFRVNLLNGVRSPSSSPTKSKTASSAFTTPTKLNKNTTLTPVKVSTPRISSPLKRLQELKDEDSATVINKKQKAEFINDAESPFNPKTNRSPTPSTPGTPSSPRYQKQITISDFISFANNFYIPSSITPRMVESFLDQRHKFTKKSEWLLACGMIHAAYIRINHKLITRKMGAKSQFQDQLFQYQKGGLMKWNMLLWVNIIEDAVKNDSWVHELEGKFVDGTWNSEGDLQPKEVLAKLGRGWDIIELFGSMITPSVMFDCESQNTYYKTWTDKVLVALDD